MMSEKNEINVRPRRIGSKLRAYRKPVHLGHFPVADRDANRLVLEGLECCGAVVDGDALVSPLAKRGAEQQARLRLVFGYEDLHGARIRQPQ